MLIDRYNYTAKCESEAVEVYPSVVRRPCGSDAPKSGYAKLIDAGMKALGNLAVGRKRTGEDRVAAVAPKPVGIHVPPCEDEVHGSDSGREESVVSHAGLVSDVSDVVVESDDEALEAARREVVGIRGRKEPAQFKKFGCGQILINRNSNSIDVKCYKCDVSIDKTWKEYRDGKQPHTKARGRMMGSHLAWLTLDCNAVSDWHRHMYCHEGLPRAFRKESRRRGELTGDLGEFFRSERPARDDESDGEPVGVPAPLRRLP